MGTVWKDRMRVLGLPITFTTYELKDGTLFVDKGLLNTVSDQVKLFRIVDVRLEISLIDRLVGQGTIVLYSNDKTDKILHIKNVKNCKEVRARINKEIEIVRKHMNMRTGEMINLDYECDSNYDTGDDYI